MIYDVKAISKITGDQIDFVISGATEGKCLTDARHKATTIFGISDANVVVKMKLREDKTDPRQGDLPLRKG